MELNEKNTHIINSTINTWIASFNAHDIETIISLYAADAELSDSGMPRPRHGQQEIAAWFRWRFRSIPITYTPISEAGTDHGQIVVSWLASGHGPRLLGRRSFQIAGKSYFTLQDDLIQHQQGSYDHLAVLRQVVPLLTRLPASVAHFIYALYLRIGGL